MAPCPCQVRGKRAIELGSGMGLGGMGFALLGGDCVLTDTLEVLPLLRRNYEHNISPASLAGGALLSSQEKNK